MTDLTSYFYVDGIDLWQHYSMFISKGSSDLLRYPPKKPSTEHNWLDEHGVDVDLSRVFFDKRNVSLKCGILVENEADYWTKRDNFIYMFTQPGLRRLSITSHGARSYKVFYVDCSNIERIKPLTGTDESHLIAYLFTLVICEPQPNIVEGNIPIIDDDGRAILT